MFYQNQHFGISEYFCKEMGENFSFPSHMHHSFEFIVIFEGKMSVTVAETDYELSSGEGVLIFPEQIHSLKSEKSKHSLVIFSSDIVSAYSRKYSSKLPVENKMKIPDYLISQFLDINEASSVIKKKAILYGICSSFDETAEYVEKYNPDISTGQITEKFYLRPIPLSAIELNPALKGHQNEGW